MTPLSTRSLGIKVPIFLLATATALPTVLASRFDDDNYKTLEAKNKGLQREERGLAREGEEGIDPRILELRRMISPKDGLIHFPKMDVKNYKRLILGEDQRYFE